MTSSAPTVLCFGEILWDFIPAGLFAGGAPFNVAYHLRQLGAQPHLVSAVGRDLLGDELLRRLRHWDMDLTGISRHHGLPTGFVRAALSTGGDASYEIATEVAWDQIATAEDTIRAASHARALVFGSLALRSTYNRAALERLLMILPPDALRVFDVNLRPPHDDLSLVREFAGKATVLKANAGEAARLVAYLGGSGLVLTLEELARALQAQIGCTTVCLTDGACGAGVLHAGVWSYEAARPVAVADTIGAGDAFLAALGSALLRGMHPSAALACGCRLGEYVASQPGATPAHPTGAFV